MKRQSKNISDLKISDTTQSDNNSQSIAESDDFVVLIDQAFMKSDKANDEFRQAMALKKPIHIIIHYDCIKVLPDYIKNSNYKTFAIIINPANEQIAIAAVMKLILMRKKQKF